MGFFPSHHPLSNLMAFFNEKDYAKLKDKKALMQQHSNSIYSSNFFLKKRITALLVVRYMYWVKKNWGGLL